MAKKNNTLVLLFLFFSCLTAVAAIPYEVPKKWEIDDVSSIRTNILGTVTAAAAAALAPTQHILSALAKERKNMELD